MPTPNWVSLPGSELLEALLMAVTVSIVGLQHSCGRESWSIADTEDGRRVDGAEASGAANGARQGAQDGAGGHRVV